MSGETKDSLLIVGGVALIFGAAVAISRVFDGSARAWVFFGVLTTAYLLLSLLVRERKLAASLGVSVDLPGFISGRAASQADVEEGNAVFTAEVDGVAVGRPLAIDIPQYAWLTDTETKERKRVVVLQAEHANGTDLVGFFDLETSVVGVGTLHDFQLLGRTPEW